MIGGFCQRCAQPVGTCVCKRDRTTALKPCPFCGSSNISVSRNTWSDGREGRYVECGECEAASGSWPIGNATVERASELAVRRWNRRAEIVNEQ